MRKVITMWAVLLLAAILLMAQAPPTLTENEELKLVNTYQAAIIAQVDYQTAKQRVEKATNAYSAVVAKVREDHKWSDATTFEINAETGKVTVHLPPADKSSQTPHEGTKENH